MALLFGNDEGLVRERAVALTVAVAGDAADPFRVVELGAAEIKDDPARLVDESAAIAMTGGRRVVRVRGASDQAAPAVEAVLAGNGDALVVLEAAELAPRSALRKLCEGSEAAAAVGCYADSGQDLEQVVRQGLADAKVEADRDAIAYLCERLGSDRMVTRQELQKLVLYAGPGGRVTVEDVAACVGDNAGLSLDDALFAAGTGQTAAMERALDEAFAGGLHPVGVLRGALRHFQRLQLALAHRSAGANEGAAMARLRPPVFFRVQDRFREEMRRWNPARCGRALDILLEAEAGCKSTGAPDEAICREALLRLARAVSDASGRRA
ncbi:MAG: DNA polymerase III subunit delta [Acetobacterales bacterium]